MNGSSNSSASADASISFLGLWTNEFVAMRRMYEEVYNLPVLRQTLGAVWFALADGAELHIYDSIDQYHAFFSTAPVPGLFVTDFNSTVGALTAAGVEWMTEPETAASRVWRHYRAPDGNIYEVMGKTHHAEPR